MRLVHGVQSINNPHSKSVVTIGNFDGVHVGHQAILRRVVEKARERQAAAIAFTFKPHPYCVLRPESAPPLISTYEERVDFIAATGIDELVEQPFSRDFSETSPEQFFHSILVGKLNAVAIVVGYDFGFGKGRQGHLDTLQALCRGAGVDFEVVPMHQLGSGAGAEVVSSSRIRSLLTSGDVEGANRLLGREFSYRGVIVRGAGRGRKLGFPTANLETEPKIMVPFGIYATRAKVGDRVYPAVTNVGICPTFQKDCDSPRVTIETYLLDQDLDLYGLHMEVFFVKRLREERTFTELQSLIDQIADDVRVARGVL